MKCNMGSPEELNQSNGWHLTAGEIKLNVLNVIGGIVVAVYKPFNQSITWDIICVLTMIAYLIVNNC